MGLQIINNRKKMGEGNTWGLTPQDCKNISFYMLANQIAGDTVYKQLCGMRTLHPAVKEAADFYRDLEVSAKTTYEEIMRSGYERWKRHESVVGDVLNQENPQVQAWEGVDLSTEQAADNRESVKKVFC